MYPLLSPDTKNNKIDEKKRVLRKALLQVTNKLALTRQELAAILGPSESTLSRMFTKYDSSTLDPYSKEGELALLLIRVYRNLDVLFGGNEEHCRKWMRSENSHLGMPPIKLIESISGLASTVEYLDAMRGRN